MPVQLSIKTHGAELVRKGLQDLTAEVPKIARLTIYQLMLRVRGKLREPAPRPSYPINWDSEKQRRAYFATEGFGGGIPHKRTGRYEKGWAIVKLALGYRIENPLPGAKFIGGDYSGASQSRIHQGRWPLFAQIVEEEVQGLPEDIEDKISYYGRSKGF